MEKVIYSWPKFWFLIRNIFILKVFFITYFTNNIHCIKIELSCGRAGETNLNYFISLVDFEIILKLLNKISIRKYFEILKNNLPNHRQNHRHPCKDIGKLLHLEFEFVLRPPMYVVKLLKKTILILLLFE